MTNYHPILNATKHVAEETRKKLAHMKKTFTDIDGALAAQRVDDRLPLSKKTEQGSIYGFGCHASENLVNIMSVNSILVHCNIIHSSYMRGTWSPVAYNFFPNAASGQKVVEAPHNLIYLPVSVDVTSTLSRWLTDQYGELLDLRGMELTQSS